MNEDKKVYTPAPQSQMVGATVDLEAQVAFTLTDASRLLRKQDVQGACPHPDDCFYDSDRVRCGPCAVKASAAKGVEVDDTHSHLPEVCRLRREVKASAGRFSKIEPAIRKAGQVAIDELIDVGGFDYATKDDLADYMTRIVDACVRAALSAPEAEG